MAAAASVLDSASASATAHQSSAQFASLTDFMAACVAQPSLVHTVRLVSIAGVTYQTESLVRSHDFGQAMRQLFSPLAAQVSSQPQPPSPATESEIPEWLSSHTPGSQGEPSDEESMVIEELEQALSSSDESQAATPSPSERSPVDSGSPTAVPQWLWNYESGSEGSLSPEVQSVVQELEQQLSSDEEMDVSESHDHAQEGSDPVPEPESTPLPTGAATDEMLAAVLNDCRQAWGITEDTGAAASASPAQLLRPGAAMFLARPTSPAAATASTSAAGTSSPPAGRRSTSPRIISNEMLREINTVLANPPSTYGCYSDDGKDAWHYDQFHGFIKTRFGLELTDSSFSYMLRDLGYGASRQGVLVRKSQKLSPSVELMLPEVAAALTNPPSLYGYGDQIAWQEHHLQDFIKQQYMQELSHDVFIAMLGRLGYRTVHGMIVRK